MTHWVDTEFSSHPAPEPAILSEEGHPEWQELQLVDLPSSATQHFASFYDYHDYFAAVFSTLAVTHWVDTECFSRPTEPAILSKEVHSE